MRTALAFAFALAATSAVAAPAVPTDDIAAQLAGRRLEPNEQFVCFNRVYDPAHLQRHPHQNVQQATMLLHRFHPDYSPEATSLQFRYAFRTRGARAAQIVGELCELKTDEDGRSHIACIDSGCGYSHTDGVVETDEPGKLRLVLTTGKLSDNNYDDAEAGPGKPIALHSDDRVFILEPAPLSACKPLIAEARKD